MAENQKIDKITAKLGKNDVFFTRECAKRRDADRDGFYCVMRASEQRNGSRVWRNWNGRGQRVCRVERRRQVAEKTPRPRRETRQQSTLRLSPSRALAHIVSNNGQIDSNATAPPVKRVASVIFA